VGYAAYVGLGTKKTEAKPYLYPALQADKDKVKEAVLKAVQQAFDGG
jgi:hypothetical protein